jgi:hypothetical protein
MPWIVLPWTASGQATSGRWLGLCVLVLLAGCATPQEKAITAHCEAEGTRLIAQQLVAQQVMRSFRIGDRIAGYRNICKTETRESKDAKGTETKIRETVCRDEPIVEPVYQQRLVSEWVDLNLPQRQSFVRACSAEAKAKGMFSHLK